MSDISSELLDPTCVGLSEFESVITPDVIMAYRTAHYSFQIDSDTIDFSIGRFCSGIDGLFKKVRRPTALCITACNPLGQELGDIENHAASEELRGALAVHGLPFFPAIGKASDGSWGPEPGYMVFGVTCEEAKRLGAGFRQNAIIWVGPSAVPELLLLR